MTASRALEELEALRSERMISEMPYRSLKRWYQARLTAAEGDAVARSGTSPFDEQVTEGLRRLGAVERETVRRALGLGLISEHTATELEAEVLQRLTRLGEAEQAGDAELRAYFEELLPDSPEDDA
jgi:hypothetical protein